MNMIRTALVGFRGLSGFRGFHGFRRRRIAIATATAALATISVPLWNRASAQVAAPTTSRPVASLLCSYADVATTYGITPERVQRMWLGDKSIDNVVREASLGTVDLAGSQTFGWFALPGTRASYGANFPETARLANECVTAARAGGVDLNRFTYLMVYLNDVQNGAEGRAFATGFNGRQAFMDTAVLTYRGLNSPGLVLHELGHILGGIHTDSENDPLGGGFVYGTNPKFPNPDGLETPDASQTWDAFNRDLMGFIPPNRKVTYAGGTQTVELSRLNQPVGELPMLIDVPYGAGGTKYVVSARTRIGVDALTRSNGCVRRTCAPAIATPGVMIQRFEPNADPQTIVMSRPGGNRATTDGVFLPGQQFQDAANSLTIAVDRFDDNGATVRIIGGPVTPTTTEAPTTTAPPTTTTTLPLPAAAITASDNYADAPEVRGPTVIGPQDNTAATFEANEIRQCGGPIKSVWTKFVVPTTGTWVVSTAGSNFDTTLAVTRPSPNAPLPPSFAPELIGCNDDFGGTPQSQVTFTANAGDTVYIQGASAGFNRTNAGRLTMTIRSA